MPPVILLRVLCQNSHRVLINNSCRRLSSQRDTLSNPISRTDGARIAVLYQAIEPPIINGVRKPRKPGGYQDSGADIAYALQQKKKLDIVTPSASPDPEDASGWCFPDTEDGIITAVEKGATHLWANTILFASHPLQMSTNLTKYQDHLRVVGQPPNLVEKFDDKAYLNDLLRKQSFLTLPRAWTINIDQYQRSGLTNIDPPFPLVAKPVRGRGSHGVKVCYNVDSLHQHLTSLFAESPTVLLEEFLSGEEATVTVMPPSEDRQVYWAMPVVVRFNHQEDIAPYNGITAVTENSRAISPEEAAHDPAYAEIQRQCETVAHLLGVTAPIRIDVRRFKPDAKSEFALFDINMKPNMTGPGRPGRENQASLTALAAASLGWDYPTLLSRILETSRTLQVLRSMQPSIS